MKNMDWNDLRYFLCVARHASLTGAAQELGVSQSTVARRVAALEESLGTALFVRHATGYYLTDNGHDVLARAEQVEVRIFELEKGSSSLDATVAGVVRLATAETMATRIIIPALPLLAARYPRLRLELITGIGMVDLPRYQADLALRLVRPEHGNLVIQKLGNMASAVYANQDYLTRYSPEERRFICWDKTYAHLPAAQWMEKHGHSHDPVLTTNSVATQYAAAKMAIGLAVLPCFMVRNDDRLVQTQMPKDVFTEELWLVAHADVRASARVRAISEFLQDIFRKEDAEWHK
ncbi:LysR family transcriptional regulator [Serratia proteamaculans]|uniref:LysR family transcriptional regulator n=1 Tax=Serratia proteamaculans TaxID=28151 RepID=UPI0039AF6A44